MLAVVINCVGHRIWPSGFGPGKYNVLAKPVDAIGSEDLLIAQVIDCSASWARGIPIRLTICSIWSDCTWPDELCI